MYLPNCASIVSMLILLTLFIPISDGKRRFRLHFRRHRNYARKPTFQYTPPSQISYPSPYSSVYISYPVYHNKPPTYVYEYKNSDSKYSDLLTGLALMNLGIRHNHGSSTYKERQGEVCKFIVEKQNGDYEATKINCEIISDVFLQDESAYNLAKNYSVINETATNVTTVVNTTNIRPEGTITLPENVLDMILLNATIVPARATEDNTTDALDTVVNATRNNTIADSKSSSVITMTVTNTTELVNALDVTGEPVEVRPGMHCFVIKRSPDSEKRKHIPCELLQTYAVRSFRRNSAVRHVPMLTIVSAALVLCLVY